MISATTHAAPRGALAAVGCALALAACAQSPKAPPSVAAATAAPVLPAAPVAEPGLTPRQRLRKAVTLLDAGQPDQARAELTELLAAQPRNAPARRLVEQIDADPKVLLGAKSFSYRVRPGETMSMLAERFLGDSNLFYALARYNGIAAPAHTAAGQDLLIPGEQKKAAPHPGKAKEAAAPATATAGKAAKLRDQALDDINRGALDGAVVKLRQAAEADPDNSQIRRDLDRALSIQATVGAK